MDGSVDDVLMNTHPGPNIQQPEHLQIDSSTPIDDLSRSWPPLWHSVNDQAGAREPWTNSMAGVILTTATPPFNMPIDPPFEAEYRCKILDATAS